MTKRVLIILLLLPCLVSGTDYYVDCSAETNGDGSYENPWKNMWSIRNHDSFQTGDDLYFKVGTTCKPGNPFFVRWNGIASNRVIIGAYYGKGQFGLNGNPRPIIDGNDNTVPGRWQSLVTVSRSAPTDVYVTVQDLYFKNSGFHGIAFNHANEIAVDNCYIYYSNSSGIVVARSINGSITNNIVDHPGVKSDGCSGGIAVSGMSQPNTYNIRVAHNTVFGSKCEGINLIKWAHHCIAEYNVVYDNTNIGIYLSNSFANIARYNIVFETGGNGYCCDYMHGIEIQNEDETGGKIPFGGWDHSVYGNLIAHCWYGIAVASTGGNVTNASVYGNTVVDCSKNIYFGSVNAGWSDNEIKNNIFWSINAQSSHSNNYNPTGVTWSHNLFYGNGAVTGKAAYNAIFSNPLLAKTSGWSPIDPGTVDPDWWKLQAGSAAKNTGIDLGSPYDIDYFGTSRLGGAWDIGAHEYTEASCTEDWTCTDWSSWSACTGGTQTRTRTCTDSNNCGTTVNKPAESETRSCGSGLVAHYTMDSAHISGTTLNDVSGNNNHGTIHGGAVTTTGRINEGLSFDGIDDYVDLGNPSSLQITGGLTISAWFRWETADNDYLVTKIGGANDRGYDLSFNTAPARIEFRISSDGSNLFSTGNQDISIGQTYHVVGVFNPSNYVRLYIDGALAQENTAGIPSGIFNSNADLNLGRHPSQAARFDGMLDDVRIYSRALSAAEILELYSLCIHDADNNPCDGCIDFDELFAFIDLWKDNQATIGELIEAIGIWKDGC